MNKFEIEALAQKDILSYGIFYVDLLQGKKWQVDSRKWIKGIYREVNPYYIEKNPIGKPTTLVIQKSTQCGMSTMGMVRAFHFADFWPIRLMYMLPRQQDYIDFVNTRVDPMIRNSERLSDLLGLPDSTRSKAFSNSYMFFMESTVEPRMMPIDAIMIDELDLSEMDHVATAKNRMDDSRWRLSYYFSTPTVPNYGINAQFNISDKRSWFVKCPKCNHYQVMEWDENLRVVGPENDPKEVFFGCVKCDTPITLDVIQEGEWVPEYPERSSEIVGFHVSQMMTHTAEALYKVLRDPHTKLREFYRKNLGKPREVGIGSLSRDDILGNALSPDYKVELEEIGDGRSSYYMGVDQGNELQVVIAKIPRGEKIPQVVRIEAIPFDEGFDRVGRLMRLFNIKKAVLDADPNRHSATSLQKSFLGKMYIADYAATTMSWTLKKDPKRDVFTNVVIGRSQAFDKLVEDVKEGKWLLPGLTYEIPQETELLIDHLTAVKRDVETRNTPSGEKEVAIWRELRPSHYAHAMVYLNTAIEIARGKNFRVAMVGSAPPEKVDPFVTDNVTKSELVEMVALLAEVPLEQLEWYLSNSQAIEGIPFPLSHKLKMCRERFDDDQIMVAAEFVKKDKILALTGSR